MELGERRTVTVRARLRWNDTGIRLVSGSKDRFSTPGRWWDMVVRRDAGGYSSRLLRWFESRSRVPSEPWFALIGAIDADEARSFPIGTGREWVAPTAGVLTCFANDVPWAYPNTWGKGELTVHRLT